MFIRAHQPSFFPDIRNRVAVVALRALFAIKFAHGDAAAQGDSDPDDDSVHDLDAFRAGRLAVRTCASSNSVQSPRLIGGVAAASPRPVGVEAVLIYISTECRHVH